MTTAINIVTLVYCSLGSIGGAVLGFLSLGFTGLVIGLLGGSLLSFLLCKGISSLELNK